MRKVVRNYAWNCFSIGKDVWIKPKGFSDTYLQKLDSESMDVDERCEMFLSICNYFRACWGINENKSIEYFIEE